MRKALHTSMGWTNRSAIALRRYSLVHTAAIGAVALGVAGQAMAQPEPPHFEAHVLERVEPRNGFDDYGYRIWSMADDGTVYGTVYNRLQNRFKAIKSRVGEGTTWLLPRDPGQVEVRPIAPSISGTVLLTLGPGYDYIYVPGQGIRRLNNLHPDWFFAHDMNNFHEIAGTIAPSPNNRAVIYRYATGFEYLEGVRSSANRSNDRGTVVGHLGGDPNSINMRIWHSDGRLSDFLLPSTNGSGGAFDINESEEVCGIHHRRDSTNDSRWAGWFWSERTGLVEIPFRYIYPQGGYDVHIYGISDDGWVLGEENSRIIDQRGYFLWHVDAGFVNLADLYDWQGRFDPYATFKGVTNGPGQITIETYSVTLNRSVYVFLNPVK